MINIIVQRFKCLSPLLYIFLFIQYCTTPTSRYCILQEHVAHVPRKKMYARKPCKIASLAYKFINNNEQDVEQI